MPTKDILNSYSVIELRKEVSKTNIKGYSKMKKSEVVELMMKPNNKPKFHHIKAKTKATKVKAAPAPAPAPKKTYKFKKKEKAKPEPAPAKKLTKTELIDKLEDNSMEKGVMGLRFSYNDVYVSYRNDYPKLAKTEKQMDKLSDYSHKQVNKQLYDHYNKNGDLKTFQVKNIYGKAF